MEICSTGTTHTTALEGNPTAAYSSLKTKEIADLNSIEEQQIRVSHTKQDAPCADTKNATLKTKFEIQHSVLPVLLQEATSLSTEAGI